jgi:hypothetical protein
LEDLRVNVAVYRCPDAFLLVPVCFQPSLRAIERHGAARFCGFVRASGLQATALDAVYRDTYLPLALDDPFTRSPAFPRLPVAAAPERRRGRPHSDPPLPAQVGIAGHGF